MVGLLVESRVQDSRVRPCISWRSSLRPESSAVALLLCSTIPDWGHLLLSKDDFVRTLQATMFKTCAGLADEVADYVYRCGLTLNHQNSRTAASVFLDP